MGGKNPVIVTDTADLDDAAAAITFSAFDLTGQKCSALSRVLVTPGAHDRLVELVSDRAKALKMADPAEADSFAGPVVSEEAFSRYARIVEQARADGFQVSGGDAIANRGYLVGPVVISGVPAEHALACEEHFLPILTISKVADFAEAMRVANMLATGLTAGVFTADREEARTFLEGIEAGCINVNVPGHATTGWFPGPQTFGGWKASGSTGKQAYGKWYVLQFARQQARKVAANMGDLLTH
jgi:1-pyrroline-5-carboxylate dehydrogenase